VYTAMSPAQHRSLVLSRYIGWLLASGPVQRAMAKRIRAGAPGPDDERRGRGVSLLWGEAADDSRNHARARLRCPEGYTLTAMTAVECARRVLAGEVAPGFQTPSRAFGPDFILGFDGVERTDLT
jgi:short subunit dehydrogenase-like uncharacterized protein